MNCIEYKDALQYTRQCLLLNQETLAFDFKISRVVNQPD